MDGLQAASPVSMRSLLQVEGRHICLRQQVQLLLSLPQEVLYALEVSAVKVAIPLEFGTRVGLYGVALRKVAVARGLSTTR